MGLLPPLLGGVNRRARDDVVRMPFFASFCRVNREPQHPHATLRTRGRDRRDQQRHARHQQQQRLPGWLHSALKIQALSKSVLHRARHTRHTLWGRASAKQQNATWEGVWVSLAVREQGQVRVGRVFDRNAYLKCFLECAYGCGAPAKLWLRATSTGSEDAPQTARERERQRERVRVT